MRGFLKTAVFLISFFCLNVASDAYAWLWGAKELVSINDITYTDEDFKNWWHNYREQDMKLPATVDSFIDWHLLAAEAQSMELYNEPSFRHKVNVFLKVRAIMQLKYDEIDSKLQMNDSLVKREYDRNYVPLWKVQAFYFSGQESAEKNFQLMNSGAVKPDFLMDMKPEKGGPKHAEERWYRPVVLAEYPDWLKTVQALKAGECGTPFPMNDAYVLLRLVEQKDGDTDDFNSVKSRIEKKLLDNRKGELNAAFFKRLMQKYEVVVDEDLLEQISLEPPPDFDTKQIIVRTSRQDIAVFAFVGLMQKEQRQFRRELDTPEKLAAYKKQMLNGMLFQTLSTWESLDRKYEEQSPLKEIFTFYKQHRLIKELEQKVFTKQITVSKEATERYYREHLNEFTPPEMVKLAIWEGEEENADQILAEMSRGIDYFEATAKYYAHKVPIRDVPLDQLDPAIRDAVEKLVKGGVSDKFPVNGSYSIVKLISRSQAKVKALEEVRETIAKQLEQENFNHKRTDFLKELRRRSTITINQKSWESLQKELGA